MPIYWVFSILMVFYVIFMGVIKFFESDEKVKWFKGDVMGCMNWKW